MQCIAVPNDAKGIASQAVAHRLGEGDGSGGGNGCVHRIAAFLQHAQACLGRQRVGGRDHIAGEHRQAGGGVGVVVIKLHG